MKKELITYNNDLHSVALRNFNASEMNILITLLSKVKDEGKKTIILNFDEIKNIINWKDTSRGEFHLVLDSVYKKLIECNIRIGDDRVWTRLVLFTEYTINLDVKEIAISVNTPFLYLINDLLSQFTQFELKEYLKLKSSYTKEFYRRMKQFKYTGFWDISYEEFMRVLDIPKTYRTCDVDKKVIEPIMKELRDKYSIVVEKKYKKQKVGRSKLVGFLFKFKKEYRKNQDL